jgi:hypothetical protein
MIRVLLAASLFSFLSCETLEITSSWRISQLPSVEMKRVLIMGFTRDADRSLIVEMERHFEEDLRSRGYIAVSAQQEFGPHAFDQYSESEALSRLHSSGFDAVLTIVLLDKEKERHYVPGQVLYTPYGYYYGRFWGYRSAMVQRIYEPGYYVTDTRYFWESNLYSLHPAMGLSELIFSAQSRSFDNENMSTLGHQYAKLIVERMAKQGVLNPIVSPIR